jgi:hypothetical protein
VKTSIVMLCLMLGLALAAGPATTPVTNSMVSDVNQMPALSSLLRPGEVTLSPGSSPQTDPPGDTLYVDLEAFNNAVGLTAGGTFFTAARLTAPRACTVSAVIFYRWNDPTDDYLFVWEGNTPTQPGAVIESLPFTALDSGWNRIDLLTPVALANGADIWVGPRINHTAGTYCLGVDDGPYVATRGDWINYQGTWEELGPLGLSMNWHIRAVLGGGSAPAHDVGVQTVLAPTGSMMPGPIAPQGRVRNFGTNPESSIPMTCWIDSAGANVFTSTTSYPGPLAPGATADVTFPASWTGVNGNTYQVRMFTSLSGDENAANDTARANIMVQSAVWETIPKPPADVDRIVHATVYDPIRDKIYMIGGNPAGATGTYLTHCQEFDPAAGTWTAKAPMTTPRGWLPGSFVDGKVYLIGGHNNAGAAIAVNECFDPVANSWSTKAPRPRIGLAALEAVWRDSLIYVMGGNNASAGFNNVDIYDPAADAWTVGTPLPLIAYMGSATCIEDTIFIVQAYSGTCWPNLYKGVIDVADPTVITWTAGPAPTEAIFNGATATMDGDIYWLGGFIDAATVTNHVWKYSTSTGTITAVTPNYPATLARCNFMVARPAAHELYVLAGDDGGNWVAPNQRYNHISFAPQGVEEQRVTLGGTIDNVMPTLVRDRVRINFTVARRGNVSLGVYDATGALVRTLVNGTVEPGSQSATWDRINSSGRRVSNGSYFYRLTVNGRTVSSKSVLFN